MRKQALLLTTVAIFLLLLLATTPVEPVAKATGSEDQSSVESTATAPQQTAERLRMELYDQRSFLLSLAEAGIYDIQGPLLAGVVPHHLVADRLIASFFRTAAQWQEAYDTVVLIGPNHSGLGSRIITGTYDLETELGLLVCDQERVQQLLASPDLPISVFRQQIAEDHTISAIVPYIKKYLPDVKLVTLLLTSDIRQAEIVTLAALLAEMENILIVGSIDFSHYLSPVEAAFHDAESWAAILDHNHESLSRMGDANMDSPGAMQVILRVLASRGAEIKLLQRSEASLLRSAPLAEGTTSYLILGSTLPPQVMATR
ncbi:MAG: AmmeMemoRadiSam system protein B [Symbiobacteriaceae bacterium]|nr:AmmeMemoRadiSam system protein B [Symbiobacteriaceae bacterium]